MINLMTGIKTKRRQIVNPYDFYHSKLHFLEESESTLPTPIVSVKQLPLTIRISEDISIDSQNQIHRYAQSALLQHKKANEEDKKIIHRLQLTHTLHIRLHHRT